jgi:acetyltransferase-like isoleucine patch superfamily enzyme
VIDDGAMLDAKGQSNWGLVLGDGVYVGRGSLIYTKNGNIELKPGANISANCELFSSNLLTVGRGTFVAAYSYLLSGGEYDMDSPVPLSEQPGTKSRGETRVGDNVWIAAHVVVADGSVIGDNAVAAAGSVVRGRVPAGTLVAGLPARPVRKLKKQAAADQP